MPLENPIPVIGVDLGGSKVAVGVVNERGEILLKIREETPVEEGPSRITNRIVDIIFRLLRQLAIAKENIKGVGVGAPGQIDPRSGTVLFAPNLRWERVPLSKNLHDLLGLPVLVDNDVRLMAIAEHRFGAGQGGRDIICIFVGTGIGSGIIINGRLLRGAGNYAGEIGHMTIEAQGPLCGCGNYGCYEALAAGPAIARRAVTRLAKGEDSLIREMVGGDFSHILPSLIFRAAEKGDRLAREILEESAEYLGIGVANLINIFNPELVILGGGVLEVIPDMLEKIEATVKRRALPAASQGAKIVPARLGNDAGIIGGALLALEGRI